jgi:hypothetical protein
MDDEDGRSMLWFATAAVVVFLIAGLGGWLALTRPHGKERAAAQAAPRTSPTAQTAPPHGETPTGGCNVPDGPQDLTAPADVKWELWEGFVMPASPTAGPLVTDGVVARCYAHSPAGALLASIQIPSRLPLVGNVKWEDIALAQLAPGPGRDAWMQRARDAIAAARPGEPGQRPAQLAAYQFVSYTPGAAVVATVYRADSGGMAVGYGSLVWEASDWKLSVLPDGSMGPPSTPVSSIPAGFTEFRGV